MAEQSDNLDPELVETFLKINVVIEAYYGASGAINRHNKQHQDDLDIEHNLRTKEWCKQVNPSIFGMILFDAMNVHQ